MSLVRGELPTKRFTKHLITINTGLYQSREISRRHFQSVNCGDSSLKYEARYKKVRKTFHERTHAGANNTTNEGR
jgi:hypothetical protein